AQIEAKPAVHARDGELPKALLASLAGNKDGNAPLPASVKQWIEREWRLELPDTPAEWSAAEVVVSMPRPGGDAWLRIERASGALEYERTDRGWISYLNDLHKGRHTGAAWSWFIDAFSLACMVFTVTGLVILKMHAANRPSTWPMVGLGLALPLLLAILFIH
ncbi:MAG TPA: PepSY-associated TM helix domain-containing protein, partial [Burkholderiaceae bacterium]|nr:PepSY-associated TM helix domain-containing protein [Burkholderiaceae bacterium]